MNPFALNDFGPEYDILENEEILYPNQETFSGSWSCSVSPCHNLILANPGESAQGLSKVFNGKTLAGSFRIKYEVLAADVGGRSPNNQRL